MLVDCLADTRAFLSFVVVFGSSLNIKQKKKGLLGAIAQRVEENQWKNDKKGFKGTSQGDRG